MGADHIDSKLPFVRELAKTYMGVDPVHEHIPIRPVVHYMMGGVDTDVNAATSIPGLFAAGEVACASLNGANRLGSNSLTECLVYGAVAGQNAMDFARGSSAGNEASLQSQAEEEAARVHALRGSAHGSEKIAGLRLEMNSTMEDGCGVYREQGSMAVTAQKAREIRGEGFGSAFD